MSRRLLNTDQLMTEELWENASEKGLEAEGGDDYDDLLFGEETGDAEGATQAALEEQAFGKDKISRQRRMWALPLRRGRIGRILLLLCCYYEDARGCGPN